MLNDYESNPGNLIKWNGIITMEWYHHNGNQEITNFSNWIF